MNVDFAGDKLFGRRFSGVPADTTRNLFDFITRVQALNDKKMLVISLLNKLQKPITEELSRPAGQLPISYVAIARPEHRRTAARSSRRSSTPIAPDDKKGVPEHAHVPQSARVGQRDAAAPRRATKIPKDGAAVTIVPNTFEKICPSADARPDRAAHERA